jgi:hypothetical protein
LNNKNKLLTNKKSKIFTKTKKKHYGENKVIIVRVATTLRLAGLIFGKISIQQRPIKKINSLFQDKANNFKI